MVHTSEGVAGVRLKNGIFAVVTSGGAVLKAISSAGKSQEIYSGDHNFAQIAEAQQNNLAFIISTPQSDKRTEIRVLDFSKPNLVVAGPEKIAEGNGIQKKLEREHPSIAANPLGGVWVAFNDNRTGSWKVHIRKYQLTNAISIFENNGFSQNFEKKIFPNPARPGSKLFFTNLKENSQISIFSLAGRQLHFFNGSGERNVPWDASRLKSGHYIVKINQGKKAYTRKLILLK